MVSAEMQRFSGIIRDTRQGVPLPLPERRQQMEHTQAKLRIPADVAAEDLTVAGRPARWIRTPESSPARAVLYLHGGGYVQGSLDTHHELMGRVARACGARVLGLGYRLAPEEPYPAALEDTVGAYRWLVQQGYAPGRIMLGGDSAGGGLALAALMALRDAGDRAPAGAFLLSPWTDLTCSGESMVTRAEADPMIGPQYLKETAALHHGSQDPTTPGVSPNFGRFSDLPPLLVQVGDDEVLLDDAVRAAHQAERAGVPVELRVWEGAFHVFQSIPKLSESGEALADIGRFFQAHTDQAGDPRSASSAARAEPGRA